MRRIVLSIVVASALGACSSHSGTATQADEGADAAADASEDVDAGDPFATPVQCSSGTYWMGADLGSNQMHPGVACTASCHVAQGSASKLPFDIAGTLYPTAHEPDDCDGIGGATVVITDANGQDHTIAVNPAGNFFNQSNAGAGAIPMPYTAKVVANGKTRAMMASQTSGDCNACHTEQGTQKAPGRILLP